MLADRAVTGATAATATSLVVDSRGRRRTLMWETRS